MYLSGRFLILILILYNIEHSDNKNLKYRKGRYILTLHGYKNGYKSVQSYDIKFPPFIPVIVLSMLNQQKNGSKLNKIDIKIADKLNNDNEENLGNDYNDINVQDIFSNSSLNKDKIFDEAQESRDKTRQATEAITLNATEITTTALTTLMNSSATEIDKNITTTEKGPYPNPNYNYDININSVSITTALPEQHLNLPPALDNRWRNFSSTINTTLSVNNVSTTTFVTDRTITKGPYLAALYDNTLIDQLSITTNSYTNNEFRLYPPSDDRWTQFSSLKSYPSSGEFKPLAGLYYDGFLHTPLKKEEFTSNDYYD